jgi:cytochrome oxidase Cu insertion factor (SCO1/SenC/PrrC family)
MRRLVFLLATLLAASTLTATGTADEKPTPVALKVAAPEFPGIEAWINTKPLDWKSLKGKVVVVHFWAFG